MPRVQSRAGAISLRLRRPRQPITIEGQRVRARAVLPRMVWAYVDHGAESETSLRANRDAFARFTLRSRVLAGAPAGPLTTRVLGHEIRLPVLLAPTGLTGLVHWSGERGAAQAAEQEGTIAVVSTASTYTWEEVSAALEHPPILQLYPCADDHGLRTPTGDLLRRAAAVGCRTLVVTVDIPAIGNREQERLHGMGNPPVLTPARILDAARHPRWCLGYVRHRRITARNLDPGHGLRAAVRSVTAHARLVNPTMTWDDVAWMRERWEGTFVVKGIMHPEDAERAVAIGADGVVVSNHGGRQLDHAPATLEVLPEIARAVGGRVDVLMDGGVRRGTDVVKALCLGARAVLIGRPFLYGLAADGPEGVRFVLRTLSEEISRTLTLMGVTDLSALDESWLLPAAGS